MSNPIRVGVIGTSWYSDLVHLPNLSSHPQAQIAAICGRNLARAQELADKYKIPAVYSDYRAMLAKAKLDAVVIAAPDDLHYEMAMAALEAGLHTICEKPLTLNAQEARTLAQKAAASGLKNMTFFTYRWIPHYRFLRQLVNDGYIGRPSCCQFRYVGNYGRQEKYAWRFDARRSNGILGDLGSHMIDMARWLVGDIAAVCANIQTLGKRPGVDGGPLEPANDSALLNLRFANGAYGSINVNAMTHLGDRGHHQQLFLCGENGTLEADTTFASSSIRGIQQGQEQWQELPVPAELMGEIDPTLPAMDQFLAAFLSQPVGDRLFIDSILADKAVTPDFNDGLAAQEVIDAAFASQQRGGWVTIGQGV